MDGVLIWLFFFLKLLLAGGLGAVLLLGSRRLRRLAAQRDTLLQEKEAVYGFVQNVGEIFADTEAVDMDTLLDRVLRYAIRTCKAGSGAIHMLDAKSGLLEARAVSGVFSPPFEVGIDPAKLEEDAAGHLERLARSHPVTPGRGLIGEAAVLGNAILVEDAERDLRVPPIPNPFLRIRTLLVVPMRFGNRAIGVMSLVNRTDGRRFALPDLTLAQALAAQASVPIHYAGLQEALEYKRQVDCDMQIAQQIQSSLLPRQLPAFPTVELAAFSHPAMEIGGDYYDVIQIDDHHIGMVIADVSGKGIGGALMMAVCRSVMRVNAENFYDPASMLSSMNKTLSANLADDMFISMLYMVLNLENHLLSFARAGHEAPILLRRGGAAAPVETDGMAIGLVGNDLFGRTIETRNINLEPGDLVVTYTDGVTEAMDGNRKEWGLDNLLGAVGRMAEGSAADLLEGILEEVLAFAGNARQADDMTMLAFRIR